MRKINLLHPVAIFVFTLIALGTSLYLYIDSYLRVNDSLREFIQRSGLPADQFKSPETWIMIVTLSILVAVILLGMILIFVYYQKMIQLYRMQQNFINGFTHELKTPIASLKIFIETFFKHELPREKQIQYLDLMRRDTDRLQENVEQILNLGKIEDKSFRPELSTVSIADALKEFISKQDHLFESAQINVGTSEGMPKISFDKKLLDIVFMNLFTNALRYNESDQKTIDIYFKLQGRELELVFKDNGIGIRRDKQKDIFKKFYQIGKSVKGSGLGLYMVSQVMRVHRGRVFATSDGIGKGSSFHIVFRVSK
ncbi:sensor histidine kinase KdpD [Bacteriovorax sp. Seq25_V]|uniref:sensor histidine kinase n=1 Tax=Bacteriovorax sp. Seq25_V TaxID=1201288 RepID=UPI00038A16F1|nr:HAMP domain-containing sensor histidine kinase [Bacteriovorax sp. Seq25_V]EQC46149.1 GHKL domain protein [Bacteriovorax sp. Seq25_V]